MQAKGCARADRFASMPIILLVRPGSIIFSSLPVLVSRCLATCLLRCKTHQLHPSVRNEVTLRTLINERRHTPDKPMNEAVCVHSKRCSVAVQHRSYACVCLMQVSHSITALHSVGQLVRSGGNSCAHATQSQHAAQPSLLRLGPAPSVWPAAGRLLPRGHDEPAPAASPVPAASCMTQHASIAIISHTATTGRRHGDCALDSCSYALCN